MRLEEGKEEPEPLDPRVPDFLIAVINAIGDISKQEAIDAIVKHWPVLREGREP